MITTKTKAPVKVLIADPISPQARDILGQNNILCETHLKQSEQQLLKLIPEFSGVILRSGVKITEAVIAAARQLRVIGRAGIGVDNIDIAAATRHGVVVMNTPFGNSITTAEHSVAMLFAMARQIPAANHSTKQGLWEKSKFVGVELFNKTLGIIGCGNIGSLVAERALALQMHVVVYDPYLSKEAAEQLGVKVVSLPELLACADIISLHVPYMAATRDLLTAKEFALVKPGCRLVNCSRGGVVNEDDLYTALTTGQLAAAAVDVYAEEPARTNKLFELENCICTPHLGALTTEAQEKVAIDIANQIVAYLNSGEINNAINMPSLTALEARRLAPYLRLTRYIASFAGQISRSGLKLVSIEYHGRVADLPNTPLTNSVMAALLNCQMESVNMINAMAVAKSRGIEITSSKVTRPSPFIEMITLNIESEQRSRSITGTLFADQTPRIIEIDNVEIEAAFSPDMLFIRHLDHPGLIAEVSGLLAAANINIATFNLGRKTAGGDALAVLGLDQPLSKAVIAQLLQVKNIITVQALKF